ncbi:MAG: hypothetical protein MJ219_04455 [Mycoplasmoidaceae bacterium]|nr:hypothetical protein [Mycoplasmoidaceae bacterium]
MTGPITYKVDTVELSQKITSFADYFKPEDIKYVSNDAICEVTHSEDETEVTFDISINPNGRGCGSDVIMIDEGDFIFYINVKIEEPAINKFNLYYHGQKLKSGDNINTSYIDSLVLNVECLPLVSQDAVSVTYNDRPIEIVDNKIVLGNMDMGENTIVLTSNHTGYSEEFKINHLSPSTITDFSIKEADSNVSGQVNTLYFPCAKTQCGLTIQIGDALVDEEFYEENFD